MPKVREPLFVFSVSRQNVGSKPKGSKIYSLIEHKRVCLRLHSATRKREKEIRVITQHAKRY